MSIKHILPGNIGLGGAPLGNMFRNIPEDEAHRYRRRRLGSGRSLLRYRTAVRLRSFLKSGWVKHSRNTLATSSF